MESLVSVDTKLRGKYQNKYSTEDVNSAVLEVRSGLLSISAASNEFNVPVQTLRDRLKGKSTQQKKTLQVLDDQQESQLTQYILLRADFGNPMTKGQILKVAGEIACLDKDRTNSFKNGSPSSSWINRFIQRHPEISLRTPSNLGRASAVHTESDLKNFFESIYKYFVKENLLDILNRPEAWWNADESGFEMNPVPRKVYARKGQKNVYSVEKGKSKEMITATYAFSASGGYIEPLLTFKKSFSKIVDIAHAAGGWIILIFLCN